MDYIFTQSELFWLDHLLPEEHRRKEDDRKKAEREMNGHEGRVCQYIVGKENNDSIGKQL